MLFERATFLVISHATRTPHRDDHRFEKISNIIKQFKLSCLKSMAQFEAMEVRNSFFAAFVDKFTTNTCIMVVMSDPAVTSAAMAVNIQVAREHFEAYVNVTTRKE